MSTSSSADEIQHLLKIPNNLTSETNEKIAEFFQLYKKATVERVKGGDPCAAGEDCEDLLSSCCSAILTTVFGTLPLEVECVGCGARYILREVISQGKS